jgi:hypothetical protein
MKNRIFWFHYNKPESSKQNKPQITLHYKKQCIILDNIIYNVPTWGHINKSQPKFVVRGRCKEIIIENKIAKII